MVTDAKRVRHDGERGINRIAGGEEAAINHVKVFEIMRFAIGVEHRGFWIVAKACGPALVCYAAERDLAGFFKMQSCVPPTEQVLQLGDEPTMRFKIVLFVAQRCPAVASDG